MSTGASSVGVSPSNLLRGSLSLMTALAWNQFVRESLQQAYPADSDKKLSLTFIYAIVITIIVVIVVYSYNAFCEVFNRSERLKQRFQPSQIQNTRAIIKLGDIIGSDGGEGFISGGR